MVARDVADAKKGHLVAAYKRLNAGSSFHF